MMQIRCPFCGPRDEPEFVCGGESYIARAPRSADDVEWGEYLYYRDNPMGVIHERWCHAYGCGRWFNAARDTVTHEISATCPMTERLP